VCHTRIYLDICADARAVAVLPTLSTSAGRATADLCVLPMLPTVGSFDDVLKCGRHQSNGRELETTLLARTKTRLPRTILPVELYALHNVIQAHGSVQKLITCDCRLVVYGTFRCRHIEIQIVCAFSAPFSDKLQAIQVELTRACQMDLEFIGVNWHAPAWRQPVRQAYVKLKSYH
jgi:hypothetical protein